MSAVEPVTIFVPCEEFEVGYLESSQASLTPIEILAIEAVHDGMCTFEDLVRFFGLGQRPTLDLILDLWNRSYLGIDLHRGDIQLPKDIERRVTVERAIRDGQSVPDDAPRLSDIDGTRPPVNMKLLLDRVSGHVLPSIRLQERHSQPYVAPAAFEIGAYKQLHLSEIAQVVRRELQRRTHQGDPVRLHAVNFVTGGSPGGQESTPVTRLLAVKLYVRLDPDGDLRFDVRAAPALTSVVRRDLAKRLEQRAEEKPDLPFFRRLREKAQSGEGGEVLDPVEALSEFGEEFDRAQRLLRRARLPRELDVADAHELLETATDSVLGSLETRLGGAGDMSILSLEAGLHWLEAALAEARYQVVIASPSIDYEGLHALLPAISSALERGLQVVLLWGRKRDEILEGPVQNALSDLQHRPVGQLLWSTRSARSNARFVIRDADALLVPSRSPLYRHASVERQRSSSGALDAGVLYRHPADALNGPIALLLDWVRREFPEYDVGRRVLRGVDQAPGATDARAESRPAIPRLPAAVRRVSDKESRDSGGEADATGAGLTEAGLQIWLEGWSALKDVLDTRAQALPDGAELVEDGRHRLWMRRCLESARDFFILSAPLMTREAVDIHFLRRLEEVLDGDSAPRTVAILTGRVKERALQREVEALVHRYPDRVVFKVGSCETSLVMSEQLALFTSFEFLSNDGYYLPTTRRRQRTEIGLLVRSAPIIETLRATVLGKASARRRRAATATASQQHPDSVDRAPRAAPAPPSPVSPYLQELLDALLADQAPAAVAGAVNRWLAAHRGAHQDAERGRPLTLWSDLQRLVALSTGLQPGAPGIEPVLRQVVAGALREHWDDRSLPDPQRWLRWVVQDLWWRGESADCLRLLPELVGTTSVHGQDPVPDRVLVELTQGVDDPRRARRLLVQLGPSLDTVEAGSHLGIGAFACLALLKDGLQEAMPLLGGQDWPHPWDTLFARAHTYWLAAGRPVAMEAARAIGARQVEARELAQAQAVARAAFAAASGVGFTFRLGKHVWEDLFGPSGVLAPFGSSIEAEDWAAAAGLLEALGRARQSPASIIERAAAGRVKRETYKGEQRIVGGKRKQCLKLLTTMLDAIQRWQELAAAFDHQQSEGAVSAASSALARDLAPQTESLRADCEARAQQRDPSAPLLRRLLDWVRPLRVAEEIS